MDFAASISLALVTSAGQELWASLLMGVKVATTATLMRVASSFFISRILYMLRVR